MFAPWPSWGLVECQLSPMWIRARQAGRATVRWVYWAKVSWSGLSIWSRNGSVAGQIARTSAFQASRPAARQSARRSPRIDQKKAASGVDRPGRRPIGSTPAIRLARS
jgi:hypothetical protein